MIESSVIIPVLNGGKLFQEVANKVLAQKTKSPFELIVIDSGSNDGSVEFCKQHPEIRLYQIRPEEYGHGKTRNYGASLANGDYLAFLTHDALPVNDDWLQNLIDTLKSDEKIAGVFGRHIAYPSASPFTTRNLEKHFERFHKEGPLFYIEDYNKYAEDQGYRQFLHFYSDNNSCMKRSIWEKIPYPHVDFAEDQIWAKKIIESGYKKAYSHEAVVYHSHDYNVKEHLQRSFDEAMAYNQWFGYSNHASLQELFKHSISVVKREWKYVPEIEGMNNKLYWACYQPLITFASVYGSSLGSRYDTLPPVVVENLSKDKSYNKKARSENKIKNRLKRFVKLSERKGLNFAIQHTFRVNKERLSKPKPQITQYGIKNTMKRDIISFYNFTYLDASTQHASFDYGKSSVNFFIPSYGVGSGGHLNIFRQISVLEKFGYICNIVIVGDTPYKTSIEAKSVIVQNFIDLAANVYLGDDNAPSAEFTFATSWQTAYYVKNFHRTKHKLYYVQDFEPYFYALGSEYYLAEETYRFGFVGVTAGDWLAEKLNKDYGMEAYPLKFSVEKGLYNTEKKSNKAENGNRHIFFYARPPTPRRMFEYGLLILNEVVKRVPNTAVVFAGWDTSEYDIPFPHLSVGVQPVQNLPSLYQDCEIGLVFSATNLSLLPLELTACGSVVVSNKGDNVEWLLDDSFSELVDWDKEYIIDAMVELLQNEKALADKRQKGLDFINELPSWETEYYKVVEVLNNLLIADQ